jgi:hypothetical protein
MSCHVITKSNSGEIKGSESRSRKSRKSITDHPENLIFTVTLANLTLKDADSYRCGISTAWTEGRDDSLRVEVFVIPGEPSPNQHQGCLSPGLAIPSQRKEEQCEIGK